MSHEFYASSPFLSPAGKSKILYSNQPQTFTLHIPKQQIYIRHARYEVSISYKIYIWHSLHKKQAQHPSRCIFSWRKCIYIESSTRQKKTLASVQDSHIKGFLKFDTTSLKLDGVAVFDSDIVLIFDITTCQLWPLIPQKLKRKILDVLTQHFTSGYQGFYQINIKTLCFPTPEYRRLPLNTNTYQQACKNTSWQNLYSRQVIFTYINGHNKPFTSVQWLLMIDSLITQKPSRSWILLPKLSQKHSYQGG